MSVKTSGQGGGEGGRGGAPLAIIVCRVMSWVQLAAKVNEATPDILPRGICDLVADYATMWCAGDWCLMQQPDVSGYKIGVITHVVQRETGITKKVKVHECGRELPGEREEKVYDVEEALNLMDEQRGPMVTPHAPRYWGEKPWRLNVDVYTDTGRVPFAWVKPVILKMKYNPDGTVPEAALRIVVTGDRFRIEAMLNRSGSMHRRSQTRDFLIDGWFVTESELSDAPEVPEDRRVRQRLA